MRWPILGLFLLSLFACSGVPDLHEPRLPPDAASKWRVRAMRDEDGHVAQDGRLQALRQLENNLKSRNQDAFLPIWTPRGPMDRSGRVRALVIHPKEPEVLWIAAGSGGLWKSEDAGAHWRPLADRLGLPAGCLVMDPQNPDVLYFGTGERFHSGGPGAGVFVSRDGGETWRRLPGTVNWRYVPAMSISPINSNLLLVAVSDPDFPERAGVYRSTNAGRTWRRVLKGNLLTPSSLAFQPRSRSRVLLALREGLYRSAETRVMYSDDAGVTWNRSGGIGTTRYTRYEIAFARSVPQIAYAVSSEGTYRSDNGGASFTVRSTGSSINLASWTGMLWVSPTDPNLLFAGGVSLARSRDGGISWERVDYSSIQGRDLGYVDFQGAAGDPGYNGAGNRRLYLLNDGGIDRIDDTLAKPLGPKAASSLDHGLQTTEYYAVAGRASDGLILGGLQDRGILRSYLGKPRSTVELVTDGSCAIIDPADGQYLYGCSGSLWIARLHPNGLTVLSSDLPDSDTSGIEYRANLIPPVVLDPNAPGRMLAGGASLWSSENIRKATNNPGERAVWRELKHPLPRSFLGDDGILISAIGIAKRDSNDIWVAHNNGSIYHTRNGLSASPQWITIDDNKVRNPLPNRWPLRILVDAFDRRRVYIAFGGFTRDNLWRTDNAGATWQKAGGSGASSLPAAPLWSMAQHPTQRDTIVVGSEVGVFVSTNAGKTWTALEAPFTAAAQDITFLRGSSTLLVGTFGRGLWTVDLN